MHSLGSRRPGWCTEFKIDPLRCNHVTPPRATLECNGEFSRFFHDDIFQAEFDEQISRPFAGKVILVTSGEPRSDPVDQLVENTDYPVIPHSDVDQLLLCLGQCHSFTIRSSDNRSREQPAEADHHGTETHVGSFQRATSKRPNYAPWKRGIPATTGHQDRSESQVCGGRSRIRPPTEPLTWRYSGSGVCLPLLLLGPGVPQGDDPGKMGCTRARQVLVSDEISDSLQLESIARIGFLE